MIEKIDPDVIVCSTCKNSIRKQRLSGSSFYNDNYKCSVICPLCRNVVISHLKT